MKSNKSAWLRGSLRVFTYNQGLCETPGTCSGAISNEIHALPRPRRRRVVLPAALFARGLTGRFASLNAATAMFGFFLWEMVKLALTVAMLIAAPNLVVALSWPALLVGLVLTMKVYWVALLFAPRYRQR